jgi:Cof subfamily protein (haloacid dehalogenase superfamily)
MDELTEWGKLYAQKAGVIPHSVGDLGLYLKDSPHKMLGVGEVSLINQMQKRLQDEFGDSLQFLKSKPNYLEIVAPGVSKGLALQELVGKWKLDRLEVMAIGDAQNDLPMITWAGVGVAIGNAVNSVKGAATLVVADNDHSGVAEAINKIVFEG